MRPILLWRAAFAIALAASAYLLLTSSPSTPTTGTAPPPDWLGHLVIFAALGLTLSRSGPRPALAFAIVLAWGIATEALQLAIPGRTGTLGDIAVDTVGALAAFIPYKPRGGG